jgi:hypothetical protein
LVGAVGIEITSLHYKSRKRNDIAPPPLFKWSLLEPRELRKRWKPLKGEPLRAKVEVTIGDIYDYRHALYPVGYILELGAEDWYAEPCEELM